MLPDFADALGEWTGSAHMSLSTVDHDDHRWAFAAVEVNQVEHGAIDRNSVTDRVDRRLVGGVGPGWILDRDGAELGAAAGGKRNERNERYQRWFHYCETEGVKRGQSVAAADPEPAALGEVVRLARLV